MGFSLQCGTAGSRRFLNAEKAEQQAGELDSDHQRLAKGLDSSKDWPEDCTKYCG